MKQREIENFELREFALTKKEEPKQTYFKLAAELVDGQSAEITDNAAAVAERVGEWCREFGGQPGLSVEVSTVEMTDAEFRALPEL